MAIHFLVLLLYDILVFRLERQGVAILSIDSREARVALHVLIMSFITPQLSSRRLGVAIHTLGSRETRGGHPLSRSSFLLICFLNFLN